MFTNPRKLFLIIILFSLVACSYLDLPFVQPLTTNIYLFDGKESKGRNKIQIENEILKIIGNLDKRAYYPEIEINHPYNETIFPKDIASPVFIWKDKYLLSNHWLIMIEFKDISHSIYILTDQSSWTPEKDTWEIIKENSFEKSANITIIGVNTKRSFEITTKSDISISTSKDKVGAPILYQHMPLPFARAKKHPELSRWQLGELSSYEEPPIVMERLPVCGNCHSISPDGTLFGMDMDYNQDKGAYALLPVGEEISITHEDFITWNNFRPSKKPESMGLFSAISPDSAYVISTVKETSFFTMIPDNHFSQFFFPIRGLIAYYSIKDKTFSSLHGADDPNYVQTCPTWSPDGRDIVFARAEVDKRLVAIIGEKGFINIEPGIRIADLNEKYQIHFNLYKTPFNQGKGGQPKPIMGASHNGKSNYFPRYSPDGKWIVFCKSSTGLAIQPDSQLYIMPATGGVARKMKCNTSLMNSWHSWSPNSRWLVFSSKINGAFTELYLTHIDKNGIDSPPIRLSRLSSDQFACLVPEFVNIKGKTIKQIILTGNQTISHAN